MIKSIKMLRRNPPGKTSEPQRNILSTQKEYPLKEITETIISCAYEAYPSLGPGLLVHLYKEAIAYELKSRGVDY